MFISEVIFIAFIVKTLSIHTCQIFFTNSMVQPAVIITPVYNSILSGVNKGSPITTTLSNLFLKSLKIQSFQLPTRLINWKSPTEEAGFAFKFSPLELFRSVASPNELGPRTTCGSWSHMDAHVCTLVYA